MVSEEEERRWTGVYENINILAWLIWVKRLLMPLGLWMYPHEETVDTSPTRTRRCLPRRCVPLKERLLSHLRTHGPKYSRIGLSIFLITLTITSSIYLYINSHLLFAQNCFVIIQTSHQILALFTIATIYYTNPELASLLTSCFNNFPIPKPLIPELNKYERNIKNKLRSVARHALICFGVTFVAPLLIFPFVYRFIKKEEFINLTEGRWSGYIFWSTLSGEFVLPAIHVASVVLYLSLLELACAMLDHMKSVLDSVQLPSDPEEYASCIADPDYHYCVTRLLRYAIQQHQRAIKFVTGVNNMYTWIMFWEIWTLQLGLTTAVFQLVKLGRQAVIPVPLPRIVLHFVMVLLICRSAEQVKEKSVGVLKSGGLSEMSVWTRENVQTARTMCACLQSPLSLKAGPFHTLETTLIYKQCMYIVANIGFLKYVVNKI